MFLSEKNSLSIVILFFLQLCEEIDVKSHLISRNSVSSDNSSNQYGSNGFSNSNMMGYSSHHSDSIGMSTPHRATPIGASDDESNPRLANGPPYSVVQVQDDNVFDSPIFGNRIDNYQGKFYYNSIFFIIFNVYLSKSKCISVHVYLDLS